MQLTVDTVSKKFKNALVLDAISLSIAPGEVVGFVGPNGAGKTTTMKIIVGLLQPDSGEVRIGDVRLANAPDRFRSQVGVLIDSPAHYPTLSAYDHLAFLSRMRGGLQRDRIEAALALVGFDPASRKRAGQFSTGMKQRLGIAMALLHEPRFLVLDEPTNGLDPVAIVEMRKLIASLARERGMGVLISSHLLHEVEQVCDRVLFIRGGRLVRERGLDHSVPRATLHIALQTSDNQRAQEILLQSELILGAEIKGAYLRCQCDLANVSAIAPQLIENGIDLLELRQERQTLEQAYLSEYGGKQEILR